MSLPWLYWLVFGLAGLLLAGCCWVILTPRVPRRPGLLPESLFRRLR